MAESIHFTSELPERNDDGEKAVPFLKPKIVVSEPKDGFSSNEARRKYLLEHFGSVCQGCDRKFDDDRYLELDHILPKSNGGRNHILNLELLCGPCNKLKSNTYTLSELRKMNEKEGYMANQQKK